MNAFHPNHLTPVFAVTARLARLAYLFATKLLPETKGRSLEEIDREMLGTAPTSP